ncbi:MAG: Asp23/Gls24 family envelope stress response protein [Erysipelotrichaceae bacterium]|nr:Asp23/Gls24 family envelope stress response protein [Erysipelotrichaceae bacterium]
MANENNEMRVPDKYGTIIYNRTVFSSITRNVIADTENVELAESSKVFRAEHITAIEENRLFINVPIRVRYNVNVSDVCAGLQEKIHETIQYMTEYKPESIDLQVVGFIF